MLNALCRRAQRRLICESLCAGLVARARAPAFFEELAVADTIDGRFDVLTLHAWLVLDALGNVGDQALSQTLVDTLFTQFDEALREQGAGDMGMTRRMTKMADAFYGRLKAYREAAGAAELTAAIERNVYRGSAGRRVQAEALARYAMAARDHLARVNIAAGQLDFGPEIAVSENAGA